MQKTVSIQKPLDEKKEKISNWLSRQKIKQDMKNLTTFMVLFSGAVLGRVALQGIPSVEPIIPLAVIAGMIFGIKEGFTLGSSAYIVSNFFVWGLQGPWTVFQAIGAAGGGVLGGIFGKTRKINSANLIIASVLGTVFFEIVMNLSGSMMGIGLFAGLIGIPMYFLTSLPFSLTHIVSNAFFAKIFSPMLKWRNKKNEQMEIVAVRSVTGNNVTDFRLYRANSKTDRN